MLRAGKIVALDTTKNLLKKFSTKNLMLRLNFRAEKKLPKIIERFSYTELDGAFIFELKKITDIAEITEALKKSKVEIIDMQTVDTDLENVFLKLTGNKK
jgi:ABC-2 type transport system ATP-binding protein